MKVIKISDAEKNRKEFEISIDKASFDEAVTAAFRKKAPTITVPGFRKGKAPRNIVEKMYGKGYFYEDALNELVPKAYEEALKESELDVVSYPEYDVKSIDDNGVVFTAKVYVKPVGEVKDYKGLEAEQTEVVVTDEQVDAEVEKARKNNAREVEITDRAAQSGDKVNIDYDGYQDGKRFDGGKAEGQDLVLGSNTTLHSRQSITRRHLQEKKQSSNANSMQSNLTSFRNLTMNSQKTYLNSTLSPNTRTT